MIVEADSIVAQSTEQVAEEIDGEVVMMSIPRGSYYGLDGVGARIWGLINEPRRVSDLCEVLLTEYDVERASCETQVLRFLNDMVAQGLVESGHFSRVGAPRV